MYLILKNQNYKYDYKINKLQIYKFNHKWILSIKNFQFIGEYFWNLFFH